MKTLAHHQAYYLVNGVTIYRVIAAPVLLGLLLEGEVTLFKWLLLVSFFTDMLDGFLARKLNVSSVTGSKLDSLGDDLTVLVAMIGLVRLHPEFVRQQLPFFVMLFFLFITQVALALYKYRKMTSFHTYLAKFAAFAQGVFLILAFLMNEPSAVLFYAAFFVTFLQLLEESILVIVLRKWKTNVKGLYWVLKSRDRRRVDNNKHELTQSAV